MASRNPFPNLNDDNHRVTSPPSLKYNCVGWAIGETRWWEPTPVDVHYWPKEATRSRSVQSLIEAYATRGFEVCDSGKLEPAFEKIAIYSCAGLYEHAARQLPDGSWTSKLGAQEDIEHDTPEDVAGGAYGSDLVFLRRPKADE